MILPSFHKNYMFNLTIDGDLAIEGLRKTVKSIKVRCIADPEKKLNQVARLAAKYRSRDGCEMFWKVVEKEFPHQYDDIKQRVFELLTEDPIATIVDSYSRKNQSTIRKSDERVTAENMSKTADVIAKLQASYEEDKHRKDRKRRKKSIQTVFKKNDIVGTLPTFDHKSSYQTFRKETSRGTLY